MVLQQLYRAFEPMQRQVRGTFFRTGTEYDNLEIKLLQRLVEGAGELEPLGKKLLTHYFSNPLTSPYDIIAMQCAVQELAEKPAMQENLSRALHSGRFSLFAGERNYSESQYLLPRIAEYLSLDALVDILQPATSSLLRAVRNEFTAFMKNSHARAVLALTQQKEHVLEFKSGDRYAEVRLRMEPTCHTITEKRFNSRTYNGLEIDPYAVILSAAFDIVECQADNSFRRAAFSGALLSVLQALSGLPELYKRNQIPYTYPEVQNNAEVRYDRAVHPLLLAKKPVANDILFAPENNLYVVSGANDGGKTTYLKMTGLLTILSQLGAPVPAQYARIRPLRGIYTHFKEQESITTGHGDFVNSLQRMRPTLETADKDTLVLIDELGGTSIEDSTEVTLNIVWGLGRIGCPTLLTSHNHFIQREVAADQKRFSAVTNLQTEMCDGVPTRRIVHGVAGKSYGVEVAKDVLPVGDIIRTRRLA